MKMHTRKIIVIPEEENENNEELYDNFRRTSQRIHNLSEEKINQTFFQYFKTYL